MPAAVYNLTVEQGVDFAKNLYLTTASALPVNLTGRTYKAEIRQLPGGSVATAFTVTVPSAAGGQIQMALSASATLAVPTAGGKYDLLENNAGTYTRLIEGTVTVKPRITVP